MPAVSFAALLRRLRVEAGLTQEELASAAQLSVRSVSDLERGVNLTARRDTARLLAGALHLDGRDRVLFESAARGRTAVHQGDVAGSGPAAGLAAVRMLPRDIASFTGRQAELQRVLEAAAEVSAQGGVIGICAIGGMAGIGKTALAVHAAHRLAGSFPDGQVFLPLHGHTPGQRPAEPADALASLLLSVGVAAERIPPGLQDRAALWRDRIAGRRLLLVLDDAVSHDQVRPLLPGAAGTLVLVTSRRHLTALEDTRSIGLDALGPDDAAGLLVRLADRPGLDQGEDSVRDIARLCGYLPLAIGLLARQLHHHPAWTTGWLAGELSATRDRLEFMQAENVSVTAAFDMSYADLSGEQQRFLRCLGTHPGTDLDAFAAAALGGVAPPVARRHLEALYDQHLLTEPSQGRYLFHDLVREDARARAAADHRDERAAAQRRLLDYYLSAARTAAKHFPRRSPGVDPAEIISISSVAIPDLRARDRATAWLDDERLNLSAAIGSAATLGQSGHVLGLAAVMHGFLRVRGYWDQALAIHHLALRLARDTGDQLAAATALTSIAELDGLTGGYLAASESLAEALGLYRSLGCQLGEASALNELGALRQSIGNFPAGESVSCHQEALRIYRALGSKQGEASALNELGLIQHAMQDYPAAAENHRQALRLHQELGSIAGQASAVNRLANVQRATGNYAAATASYRQALDLHRELGNQIGEASALIGLGNVQRDTGSYQPSAASYDHALRICRRLGYRLGEARALNETGNHQRDTGNYTAAIVSHQQSLAIYQDLDYQLGQAHALGALGAAQDCAGDHTAAAASHKAAIGIYRDLNDHRREAAALARRALTFQAQENFDDAATDLATALKACSNLGVPPAQAEILNHLGDLQLATGQHTLARTSYQQARAIATKIGHPAQQARAIEGLAQCQLQEGLPAEHAILLQHALAIYQAISSPHIARVQKALTTATTSISQSAERET